MAAPIAAGLAVGVAINAAITGESPFPAASDALSNAMTAVFNNNANVSKSSEGEADPGQAGGGEGANTNPYGGPVTTPVTAVDGQGNAIPVKAGEQITSSPNGDYQQVRDSNGRATGTRLDRGGHKGQSDPKAQGPHAHVPGMTTPDGNPHLPIN